MNSEVLLPCPFSFLVVLYQLYNYRAMKKLCDFFFFGTTELDFNKSEISCFINLKFFSQVYIKPPLP